MSILLRTLQKMDQERAKRGTAGREDRPYPIPFLHPEKTSRPAGTQTTPLAPDLWQKVGDHIAQTLNDWVANFENRRTAWYKGRDHIPKLPGEGNAGNPLPNRVEPASEDQDLFLDPPPTGSETPSSDHDFDDREERTGEMAEFPQYQRISEPNGLNEEENKLSADQNGTDQPALPFKAIGLVAQRTTAGWPKCKAAEGETEEEETEEEETEETEEEERGEEGREKEKQVTRFNQPPPGISGYSPTPRPPHWWQIHSDNRESRGFLKILIILSLLTFLIFQWVFNRSETVSSAMPEMETLSAYAARQTVQARPLSVNKDPVIPVAEKEQTLTPTPKEKPSLGGKPPVSEQEPSGTWVPIATPSFTELSSAPKKPAAGQPQETPEQLLARQTHGVDSYYQEFFGADRRSSASAPPFRRAGRPVKKKSDVFISNVRGFSGPVQIQGVSLESLGIAFSKPDIEKTLPKTRGSGVPEADTDSPPPPLAAPVKKGEKRSEKIAATSGTENSAPVIPWSGITGKQTPPSEGLLVPETLPKRRSLSAVAPDMIKVTPSNRRRAAGLPSPAPGAAPATTVIPRTGTTGKQTPPSEGLLVPENLPKRRSSIAVEPERVQVMSSNRSRAPDLSSPAPGAVPAITDKTPWSPPADHDPRSQPQGSRGGDGRDGGVYVYNRNQPQVDFEEIRRANSSFFARDFNKAEKRYLNILARDANHREALIGLASLAVNQRKYTEARGFYQRILERNPRDREVWVRLVSLAHATDPVRRESQLQNLIRQQPGIAHFHFVLGNVYLSQKRWLEAGAAFDNALILDPDNADVLFNLAVSLDHARQFARALNFYRKALAMAAQRPAGFDLESLKKRIAKLEVTVQQVTKKQAAGRLPSETPSLWNHSFSKR